MSENTLVPYNIIAHYRDMTPHKPKNEMEGDIVKSLVKMGFETDEVRILFEKLKSGKLLLELENIQFSSQLKHRESSYEKLMKIINDKYHIDFKNDVVTNRMKKVENLRQYVNYLKKNNINWTYLEIFDSNTNLQIGSIYSDEPIPKRLIE